MGSSAGVTLGIKVDVGTLVGYQRGVPSVLDELAENGVAATFFFAVGPDRSGLAVRRVLTQRGLLGKMIRNRALTTYGWRTGLYGTLLRAPQIVASDPRIVQEVSRAGHEVGAHGWDHVAWHDGVGRMSGARVREELSRAFDSLARVTGAQPTSFAAPGWQCCEASLSHHDDVGLAYASDVRGVGSVFRPRLGERAFRTPQVPTSLPTLDELWGREVHAPADAAPVWMGLLRPGLNVLTVHAEVEGLAMRGSLRAFLQAARTSSVRVRRLDEVVADAGRDLPVKAVRPGRLPGRAGTVWCVCE